MAKQYCPDCGNELQEWEHKDMVFPYHIYSAWKCTGRCREEICEREGLKPEQLPSGVEKYKQYVGLSRELDEDTRGWAEYFAQYPQWRAFVFDLDGFLKQSSDDTIKEYTARMQDQGVSPEFIDSVMEYRESIEQPPILGSQILSLKYEGKGAI